MFCRSHSIFNYVVFEDKSHENGGIPKNTTASGEVGIGHAIEVMDTLGDITDGQKRTNQKLIDFENMVTAYFNLDAKLKEEPKNVKEVQQDAERLPKWDEWAKMKHECFSFDRSKAQFILIAGKVSSSEVDRIASLSKVKWHSIIDFDPDSEANGLFQAFGDKNQNHSEMWSPARISEFSIWQLASAINFLRSPWLFARGRTKDSEANRPRESFEDWKKSWMGLIGWFLTVVTQSLDVHRPVVTLILPFDGSMNEYISIVFDRFHQELSSVRICCAKHVVLTTESAPAIDLKIQDHVEQFQLPTIILRCGLDLCLGYSPERYIIMPSRVAEAPASLTERDFLYFSEYLTLLYDGCENKEFGENPDGIGDKERAEIIEDHKQAFLSGQTISFVSLSNDHDATRDILQKLSGNLQRYMIQKQVPLSSVIEIVQQPGAGASTLARRTLWNLHQQFPCAIVNPSVSVSTQDEEDMGVKVESVCDRIQALETHCFAPPLVLVDGETFAFRRPYLAQAIAEELASKGRKAVILHCVRVADLRDTKPSLYGIKLKSTLSHHERDRFKEKYRDYLPQASEMSSFTRSFHFPLFAFLEEFRDTMNGIVASNLRDLKEVETAVIRFVALVQKYAAQSVPMSLIYNLFLKDTWTNPTASLGDDKDSIPSYETIYSSFTDHLRVLLVQSGTRRVQGQTYGMCNLQHVSVAEIVLNSLFVDSKKYYHLLEQYLNQLISMDNLKPIARNHWQLFEDLLLHNKDNNPRLSFSVLIEELKRNLSSQEDAGKLLELAASVFPRARFYSHAARYYLYCTPHKFDKAQKMVQYGFSAVTLGESKLILYEMKGLIERIQLSDMIENDRISSVHQLESLASRALEDYNLAITNPPSKPDPLVGKVQVWVKCLQWIARAKCDGIVANVVRYLSTEASEFFCNLLSNAFSHLDIIENLLAIHTVSNEAHTLEKVNECKTQLLFVQAKSTTRASTHVRHWQGDIIAECEKLLRDRTLARLSQVELKRLIVYYFLNKGENEVKLEQLKAIEIRYLYRVLRELVKEHQEYRFAQKLLRVATYLSPQESLSLDEAITVVQDWQYNCPYDPYVYFYSYVLYFLKVLNGSVVEYGAKYEASLTKCMEKCRSYANRMKTIFYLGKGNGESGLSVLRERVAGISRLVEQEAIMTGSEDVFWKHTSRQILQELEGRIKQKSKNIRHKTIYFELTKGGLHIDVGRNHMQHVGDVGRDYQVDQLVKFVVGFNLSGPQPHGIVV